VFLLFGDAGLTAYAAGNSLPGDALFPLKTKIEEAPVKLTDDSAAQARLYLQFARQRLSELQTLIDRGRYTDIALATGEFANNLQKALRVSESLSRTNPAQASALNSEVLVLLRDYSVTPIIIILPASAPTSLPASSPTDFVITGEDGTCQGSLGAVTVENLEVLQGTSCMLDGTRVQGNIFVRNAASLTAQRVTVIGNIQAEGASSVAVLADSTVDGSIQLKQGGAARVENVIVNGAIQFESNNGALSAAGNQVGENIQVFENVGGITIADNIVKGNLQCKENNPAPAGGNNTVQGTKEDQCAGL